MHAENRLGLLERLRRSGPGRATRCGCRAGGHRSVCQPERRCRLGSALAGRPTARLPVRRRWTPTPWRPPRRPARLPPVGVGHGADGRSRTCVPEVQARCASAAPRRRGWGGRGRTHIPRVKTSCPAVRRLPTGRDDGDRTRFSCLEGRRVTKYTSSPWSGRRGSNPRPRRWQRRALPSELRPHGAWSRTRTGEHALCRRIPFPSGIQASASRCGPDGR